MNTNEAYPDNNPKTTSGVAKVPLHLVPPAALHYLAMAFADGARKYGPYNWRDKTVSSSVYYAAALRHLTAWWDGEEESSDAKVHHLAHALACLVIVLDAKDVDKLNDDRPTKGAASYLQEKFNKVDKEKEIDKPAPVQTARQLSQHPNPVVHSGVPNHEADVRQTTVHEHGFPYFDDDRGMGSGSKPRC